MKDIRKFIKESKAALLGFLPYGDQRVNLMEIFDDMIEACKDDDFWKIFGGELYGKGMPFSSLQQVKNYVDNHETEKVDLKKSPSPGQSSEVCWEFTIKDYTYDIYIAEPM